MLTLGEIAVLKIDRNILCFHTVVVTRVEMFGCENTRHMLLGECGHIRIEFSETFTSVIITLWKLSLKFRFLSLI